MPIIKTLNPFHRRYPTIHIHGTCAPSMRCLYLSSHHARTPRRTHLLAPSLMIALRLLSWSPPFLVSDRRISSFHGSFHDEHV
jgi:hypothetical protein